MLALNALNAFAGYYEEAEEAYKNKDFSTALTKYRIAAEQGNSMANIKIGILYDSGLGVQQDFSVAMLYYKTAARQGHVLGFLFVSAMYENGQGVSKDLVAANRWKQLAAACKEKNSKNCLILE